MDRPLDISALEDVSSGAPTIRAMKQRIQPFCLETPVWELRSRTIQSLLGSETRVTLKLELFQHTGSFKVRGALAVMLSLSAEQLARGVTAVSAGNHAIAVAYCAKVLGTSAKVVMPKTSNPFRLALCQSYGAEVVQVDNVHAAFEVGHKIQHDEGRALVHPFEGPLTALGTATLGLEMMEQAPDLDAVIVPIGGGGLCAGVAAAVKQLKPSCQVIGIEPVGADSMSRSFRTGKPERIEKVNTIADTLGAPHAAPYSFGLCKQYLDDLICLDDDIFCRAMALLFAEAKLAVEPAGAATTALLLSEHRERFRGKHIGLIVCGANIDIASFVAYVNRGMATKP